MIAKTTKLFAILCPSLSGSRIYQLYNYVFESNGVDAAFINFSIVEDKIPFTLENIGNSEIISMLIDPEFSDSVHMLAFFGLKDGCISRVDIKDGSAYPVTSPVRPDFSEEGVLESLRLNFFEWFGFFPNIPDDALKTLKESAPRESILTRSE